MSSHAPKIAALEAYQAGVLSLAGTRRIETHLSACSLCRDALGAIRLYDGMAMEARDAALPELDWSRMEAALAQEAEAAARTARSRQWPTWVMPTLALAAGALFALWFFGREEAQPVAVETPTAPPAPEPLAEVRSAVAGQVTAATGELTEVGAEDALEIGDPVREGMRVATGDRAVGHVRFVEGTGVVLLPDSDVGVDELREGLVTLTLRQGTVASEVAHLAEGDHYRIDAGEHLVRVRGTRFAVSRARGIAVTVDEGVVEVLRDGELLATVEAPGTWRSGDDAPTPLEVGSVPAPHGLADEAATWPVLRLPGMGAVERWEVGGEAFHAAGELALRVPEGEVTVSAFGRPGLLFRQVVIVDADGAAPTPAELRPSAPERRQGELDPALIAPVIQRGMRRLQRCQEEVARNGPTVVGRFRLRVSIDRNGDVEDADLVGEQVIPEGPIPPAFERCVLGQVRGWVFPPPTGGVVTFEQPITFRTR